MRSPSPAPNDSRGVQATRSARTDLFRAKSFIWLWGIPVVVLVGANVAYRLHSLSFVTTGVLMTAATAWFGLSCFINGRRCGRTHCVIDGYLLALLTIVGVLNVLRAITVTWPSYLNIFLVVIAIGFAPECCGLLYLRPGMSSQAKRSRR